MTSNPTNNHEIFSLCNISLLIPPDWYLSKFIGTSSEGSFTIVSPKEMKLKSSWSKKSSTIFKALNKFKKLIKKSHIAIEPSANQNIYEITSTKDNTLVGLYTLDMEAKRDIFLTFWFNPSPYEIKKILSPLLNPTYRWCYSLFGTKFKIPNDYRLQQCRLYTGLQEYKFSNRKSSLTVWTMSLAQELLKDKNPENWVLDFINKKHKKRYVFEPLSKSNGYNTILAKRRFRWSFNLKELFTGYPNAQLVFDEVKNRLYIFLFQLRNKDIYIGEKVMLGSLPC